MSFYWPHLLWLLAAPALLLGWDLFRRRRSAAAPVHPKITRAEASHASLSIGKIAGTRGARVRWRLTLGLACAVLALARPQWGRLEEPVFDQAREILIAIDLSRSMLAQDVKPSRLERAKLLITSLLERLAGERVGLLVFSGTSFLQSPLSADYEILREFLPALGPDYLPEGGSNYSALLAAAREAFGESGAADRFLIILSDGEATDDEWQSELDALTKQGVRVLGLGIGTEQGAMIPDGAGAFVKDERGAVVLSRLGSSTLRQLAEKTGGVYTDASNWVDLAQLVESTVEKGRKGDFKETNRVRFAERFQWALGPALLFLLWSFWREFPVQPRTRNVKLAPTPSPPVTAKPAVATVATALLLAALALTRPSLAAPASPAATDPLAAPLSKLVAQFSTRDALAARDYAELARTTLTYGQRVQSGGQPVPEGPIRDALQAADAGAALDAKAADWPQLRRDLEALLKKNEEQQQPDQSEDDKNEPKGQTGKNGKENQPNPANPEGGEQSDQQSSDAKSSEQKQKEQPSPQRDPGQPGDPSKEDQSQGESQEQPPQKDAQSAFGDMQKQGEQPPPPPQPQSAPGEVQKIGGQPERKDAAAAQVDPALAVPLQKLEQLKNQDSPARLYQLMQDPKDRQPTQKGRNW